MFIERSGHGAELFLVHGWAMHRHCWRPLQDALSARYCFNLVDLPGHGDSIGCAASLREPQALLGTLLDLAPRDAVWIGWSLGGLLVQLAALKAPECIHRVISIGMGARFTTTATWPAAVAAMRIEETRKGLATDPSQALYDFVGYQTPPQRYQKTTRTQLQRMLQTPLELEELQYGLNVLENGDCREGMSQYPGQVLYISGADDRICPPPCARRSAALCRNGRFETIAGAGHAPLLSHPSELAQLVESFEHRKKCSG